MKQRKINYRPRCPFCKKTAIYCYCGSFQGNGELTENAKRAIKDKKDKVFLEVREKDD